MYTFSKRNFTDEVSMFVIILNHIPSRLRDDEQQHIEQGREDAYIYTSIRMYTFSKRNFTDKVSMFLFF